MVWFCQISSDLMLRNYSVVFLDEVWYFMSHIGIYISDDLAVV